MTALLATQRAQTSPGIATGRDLGNGTSASLNLATLEAAYDAHSSAAYALAYRILGDRPAAEDAVQDAFMKLWTGAAQFDPARGSVRGLLLLITRHQAIDSVRKGVRRQRSESTYCIDATCVTDGPEGATERSEEARQVRNALSVLPGNQRNAIEMAFFSGLTSRQIAAEMVVPIGTVKSRMRLGMRKLALTLGDATAGGETAAGG